MANPLIVTSRIDTTDKTICPTITINPEFITSFVEDGSTAINVIFAIDTSDSMGDVLAESTQTKIKIVCSALIDAIEYFAVLGNNGHSINLTIIKFANESSVVVENKLVNSSTRGEIIESLTRGLVSHGGTNIGNALTMCNSILTTSESHIYFITDGYHNQGSNIEQLVSNFVTSGEQEKYVGIGIGIAGDYDAHLMNRLFTRFSGCPTQSDASDAIIGNSFSGASVFLKDVQFEFSSGITDQYNIVTSLKKNAEGKHILSSFNIAHKIPIGLVPINPEILDTTVPLVFTIRGIQKDSSTKEYTFNLSENVTYVTDNKLITSFYDLEKKFVDIVTTPVSQIHCRITLQELKRQILELTVPEDHLMKSFYVDLAQKIDVFLRNIQGIHMSGLSPEDFNALLREGSRAVSDQASGYTQYTQCATLSRQISEPAVSTASAPGHVIFTESPLSPILKRSVSAFPPRPSGIQRTNMPARFSYDAVLPPIDTVPKVPIVEVDVLEVPVIEVDEMLVEAEAEEHDATCVICMNDPIEIMIMPCKHACTCKNCTKQLKDSCPVCRKQIESIKEINTVGTCRLCKTSGANILYLPCSHVQICFTCMALNKTNSKCEECDGIIKKKLKLFNV